MMSEVLFSQGGHSKVFLLGDSDAVSPYNGADIVRVERHHEKSLARRLELELRIAGMLFPGQFPEVTGSETLTPSYTRTSFWDKPLAAFKNRFELPTHRLYSKLVLTDQPGHDLFSLHMLKEKGKEIVMHDCANCVEHRQFHAREGLEDRAKVFAEKAQEYGITLPKPSDWSDHCLVNQRLLFFEVEDINTVHLIDKLRNSADPNDVQVTLYAKELRGLGFNPKLVPELVTQGQSFASISF